MVPGGRKQNLRGLLRWLPLLLLLVPAPAAPLTPSGSVITHSFQASFRAPMQKSANSNQTRVTVQDLVDPSIFPPRQGSTLPQQPIDFKHTVSNRGNASDSFRLRATPVGAILRSDHPLQMQFFTADGTTPLPADADGNPVLGPIPAGGSLDFVLRVTPPAGSEGKVSDLTVTAVSVLTPTRSGTLSDQVVVPATTMDPPAKSVVPAGAVIPGTLLTYSVAFSNSGAPATNVVLSDPLDPLLDYLPGSALLPAGITGTVSYDSATRTLSFLIPAITGGFSGSVTYQARVRADAPGDSTVRNTAALASDQNSTPTPSNTTVTPVLGPTLRVTKVSGKSTAEAGDIVSYTVRVENIGGAPLSHATVNDTLPRGFRYLNGSTLLDGAPFADPTGGGEQLSWDLGVLAAGQLRTLIYRTVVSADAPTGNGVNWASASAVTPGGNSSVSPAASATVLIRSSLLGSKAIILGRLFIDRNGNGIPDTGEPGVSWVRVYLEDGSFVFTDSEGKYSFTGLSAGNHVVKIDRSTLPPRLKPVPYNTAFAGVGWSQFITVPFGGPARGDFALAEGPAPPEPPPAPLPVAPAPLSAPETAAGEVALMRIAPDRIDLPADGKSVIPFTVELLTPQGKRVAGVKLVTVAGKKGVVVEPDADPTLPGHQVRVVDGVGVFHLRSAGQAGPDLLTVVTPNGVQGKADLYYSAELRDWIVVGLGSFTVGAKAVSGHLEKIEKDDRFDQGIFHEERLAFFAKGKILGKYLLTAAYDSGKERPDGVFQVIDPEKYYPVYGDATDIGYEAQSRGKIYLKLEAGRSYLLAGDYRTDLSENEFSRYDRGINGVKAEYNDLAGVSVKGFASKTAETVARDEIPGNGSSGYYFLSRKPLFVNSERVRIETRDRYHTERVVSVVEKVRYADYSIDYNTGSILFKEPVPSYDKNFNPITIVVVYESDAGGTERYVYGGRAVAGSATGTYIGTTAVVEEGALKDVTLFGLDGALKLGDKVTLRGEGAVSDTHDKGRGNAWKSELFAHPFETLDLGAYYRNVDRDFSNSSMTGNETGTRKYGGRADYRAPAGVLVSAESFVQKDALQGTTLFGNQLGVARKFSLMDGEAGFKRMEQEGVISDHADLLYAGIKTSLTSKLDLTLRREQLLESSTALSDYQSKSQLKLDYRISDRTRAFLSEEYQEGSPGMRQTTLVGVESKLSERMRLTTGYQLASGAPGETDHANVDLNTRLIEEKNFSLSSRTGYQIENALSQERGQAILGLNSRWELVKGTLVSSSLERVQAVQGGGTGTAFTLAGEYLRQQDLKLTGRYQIRSGHGETDSLYGAGAAYRVNSSLTLLGKGTFWDKNADLGHDLLFDGYVGTAWRPLSANPWQLLTLVRYKLDSKESIPGGEEGRSIIVSAEPTYRITKQWSAQGKYAGKRSWEESAGVSYASYTDLFLAGISYDLTEKWELSLYLKLMNQYDSGMHSLGAVASAGYRIYRNVVVSVGYNYARLDDRDLTGESYQGQGPFFGVKVKFDEDMFELSDRKVVQITEPAPPVPVPVAKAATPVQVPVAPLPAPKPVLVPALYLTGETLDQPLEISGSAELFTLLINGEKALLPSTDVTVTRERLEGSVQLEGGRLKEPLTFKVSVEKPEQVRRWSFVIRDGSGAVIRTVTAEGRPPQQIAWNGETDRAPLVQGEVYQYQLEITYRDGSSFSTGRGLFGIDRREAVLLTLSGGAFIFDSARLTEEAKRLLKEAARVIKAHPEEKVILEGHTDGVGTIRYNMLLSQKRCAAAADYLIKEEGIPSRSIVRHWYGKGRPLADNRNAEGRRINRRVELKGNFQQNIPSGPNDRFRGAPYAIINDERLALDPDGRFVTTLPAQVQRIKVELGDSLGRRLATVIPVPALVLATPAGGEVLRYGEERGGYRIDGGGGARCTLTGGTDPGTSVELEGKPVPVDAGGSFSADLPLRDGVNVFGMVLRNGAGCSRLLNLRVLKSAHDPAPGRGAP